MPVSVFLSTLRSSGTCLGSVFAGDAVGNLTVSFLWEGAKRGVGVWLSPIPTISAREGDTPPPYSRK